MHVSVYVLIHRNMPCMTGSARHNAAPIVHTFENVAVGVT